MEKKFKKIMTGLFGFGMGGYILYRQSIYLYKLLSHQEIQQKIISRNHQLISVGILLPTGLILVLYTYLLIKKLKEKSNLT